MDIKLSDISYSRGEQQVLESLNLAVRSGECVVISGASGSGKSLLFSILCGIVIPNSGQVEIGNLAILQMDDVENTRFRRSLGAVFQRSALISNLSLAENFLLPLNRHFSDWSEKKKQQKIKDLSQRLGLFDFLEQRTDSLSNGLSRLAGFARAAIIEPKCLVWDAPFMDMDQAGEQLIIEMLQEFKQNGATLVLFTNRQPLIEHLADTQYHLDKGNLRQVYETEQ